MITFYLLSDPKVMRSLRQELESAIPEPSARMEIKDLEKLQYLVRIRKETAVLKRLTCAPLLQTSVIQEGLRLAFGVSTRLQRVCPDEVLQFDDGKTQWKIPAGVSLQASS